jgi:hypothetical protein
MSLRNDAPYQWVSVLVGSDAYLAHYHKQQSIRLLMQALTGNAYVVSWETQKKAYAFFSKHGARNCRKLAKALSR